MAVTRAGEKPGGTSCSRHRLRTSSVAATSSTTASATWAPMNTSRTRCGTKLPGVRPPSLSVTGIDVDDRCSAGARPKSPAAMTAVMATNASTVPSIRMSAVRGIAAAASSDAARVPHAARASPAAPPSALKHQALGQELADQPPPAGSERRPHRELALPRRRRRPAAGWPGWRRR